MIVEGDDELRRLRVRVRELEEELAEWKRAGSMRADDEGELNRVFQLTRWLGVTKARARVLCCLIDRPGKVCSYARLLDLSYPDRDGSREPKAPRTVKVHVHYLRQSLGCRGFPDAIRTLWGEGYAIDGSVAGAITEAISVARAA